MGATSIGPLADYPSSLLMRSGTERHGSSVRTDKLKAGPPYEKPTHLFMVDIRMNSGKLEVRYANKQPINYDNIEAEEDNLYSTIGTVATNAFELIKFTERTAFIIVLSQPGWEFYYPDPGNPNPNWPETHDPIVFIQKKAVIYKNTNGYWVRKEQPFDKNRTFYNCKPRLIGHNYNAVRCINFMTKNKDGDILEYMKKQTFSFNIFLRVPFSLTDPNDERKITIILDPDGENQGPPRLVPDPTAGS